MTKTVLSLFLALTICGAGVKNSNPSSIVSYGHPPLEITALPNSGHAPEHDSTRYCVFLTSHKNGRTEVHLLTDSGEITGEQLKRSFREIGSVREAIENTMKRLSSLYTLYKNLSKKKPSWALVIRSSVIVAGVIDTARVFHDFHKGKRRMEESISDKYDKISEKDMLKAIKRIRSEESSRPGSCDHHSKQ